MLVSTPAGMAVNVDRRWFPWRPRKRAFDSPFGPLSFVDGADDAVSFVVMLAAGIAAFLFGGIVLTALFFVGEAALLLLLVIPLLVAARVLYVLPWVVEATNGSQRLGAVGVRGWGDSQRRIHDIASAYQRGEDPFKVG